MIFEPEKVILTETVNGDFIQKIFKEAKNMKAEYVLVPRNLMQNTYLSSLIGLSHNAIVTHGVFSSLRDMVHYDLWKLYLLTKIYPYRYCSDLSAGYHRNHTQYR